METCGHLRPLDVRSMNFHWMKSWVRPEGSEDNATEKVEVTINTVYATLFIYYPLLEDVLFIATCFGSVEPPSDNIHMMSRKLLCLRRICCLINFL
jgi:hypothetical protein